MDYQKIFNNLCLTNTLRQMGTVSREEQHRYIKGVFDTLEALGLMEDYNKWCAENDILVLVDDEEYV